MQDGNRWKSIKSSSARCWSVTRVRRTRSTSRAAEAIDQGAGNAGDERRSARSVTFGVSVSIASVRDRIHGCGPRSSQEFHALTEGYAPVSQRTLQHLQPPTICSAQRDIRNSNVWVNLFDGHRSARYSDGTQAAFSVLDSASGSPLDPEFFGNFRIRVSRTASQIQNDEFMQ